MFLTVSARSALARATTASSASAAGHVGRPGRVLRSDVLGRHICRLRSSVRIFSGVLGDIGGVDRICSRNLG